MSENPLNNILFNLENNNKILDYKYYFDDLIIWPNIRWKILSNYVFKEYRDVHSKKIINFKEYLLYLFRIIRYNSLNIKKNYDIVYFNSLIRKNIKYNNKYFNPEIDYYILERNNDSISLEISNGLKTYIPRAIKNYRILDYYKIKSIIFSYFVKQRKMNYEDLDDFLNKINLNLSDYGIDLKKTENKIKYHKKYFLKMIRKIKPKVIFFRMGYYGGINAYYIKWAKDMGIKTAEFQHGIISKMHPAYNYGVGLINSKEYKKYTPDYFLTYGDYWNKEIRIPGKSYTIGNPHFHESIKNYNNVDEEKETILIVSQGIITNDFVNIAEFLAKKFKNKKIIFKLHPGEVRFEERYKSLYKYSNVEIKKDGDIYELLARYEYIVASFSTVVFEALAFKKKIFILKNKYSDIYIPKNLGVRFDSNEELVDLINNKNYNKNYNNIDYYFNSNWRNNYLNFLKEINIV